MGEPQTGMPSGVDGLKARCKNFLKMAQGGWNPKEDAGFKKNIQQMEAELCRLNKEIRLCKHREKVKELKDRQKKKRQELKEVRKLVKHARQMGSAHDMNLHNKKIRLCKHREKVKELKDRQKKKRQELKEVCKLVKHARQMGSAHDMNLHVTNMAMMLPLPPRATYNQNALKMFTDWTWFHNCSMEFLERQRCLLALIRAENNDSECDIIEVDQRCRQTALDIMQRVREHVDHLERAQVDILIQEVAEVNELNEQLQFELKQMREETSKFTPSTGIADHSELAERLDLQTARLAEKDSQIIELKERLAALNRDASTSDVNNGAVATSSKADEDAFVELDTEAVLDLDPRSLINHIRKDLGICMESFNPVQHRVIRAMRSKLGSALEKLSHDIYSNDSQIVLELIQNADDNYYKDVTPFLSINICSKRSIFVSNNECGFKNANVIAISNVGGSTKKHDCSRFTGHKGIGFKSVFKVTRTPYIISKDFCFRFNLDGANAEDNIGYILPEWVEREEIDALVAPERIDPNMTHFYFPLAERSRFPAQELYRGIDMVPLFLRQLHKIELALDNKKKVVVVNKQARLNGPLETYHLLVTEHRTQGDGVSSTEVVCNIKFRVYRKMLDVPKDLQTDPAGRTIPTKTELILAFPTISDGITDPRDVEIQKVYSYLPVEKAGFRFLIQADFHLVSSRDRVHAQSLYNRWLSSMIPAAFEDAFELRDDAEQEIKAETLRNDLFFFLPNPHDLTRTGHSETSTEVFWRRVMKGIRDKVLDTPCVLTETFRWAKPDQVCIRPKGYDLFSNPELQTALCKEYVSKSLGEDAIYSLGCQYLSPSEALTIVNHPSFCALVRPKQWFYKLYGFLGSQIKRYSDFINQMFCAKIFLLDTGDITNLEAGRLFIMTPAGHYKIGPHVLRLLDFDPANYCPGDPVLKFLESVGITSMTVLDVANSIWAGHQRLRKPVGGIPASTTETTCEQFWEQLRFLKDHWFEVAPLYPHLGSKLMVPVYPKNMQGNKVDYQYGSIVYFSDLKSEFEQICPLLIDKVLFLNDQYLNEVTDTQEKQTWIKFLTVQIGINQLLRVVPTEFKDYVCSIELDIAIHWVKNKSVWTWAALLGHMQKNWDHFKRVKNLVSQIRNESSGFRSFLISGLFPDLVQLKFLLLDKDGIPCICLPTMPGLTNVATMADLGIQTTVSGDMLNKLASYLEQLDVQDKSRTMDLFVWKKIYAAMVKYQTAPNNILMLGNDGFSRFECVKKICLDVPSMLTEYCDIVKFPAEVYADVQGMEKWIKSTLSILDYQHILVRLLKTEVRNHRELELQIIECYRQMNTLIPDETCVFDKYLVFDKNCLLRGRTSSNHLVMPDRMDIYYKFLPDPKANCFIVFVHPELAKLENVSKLLCKKMNIPLLSNVVQICPMPHSLHGYYVHPIGTTNIELPTYMSSHLTNLYRTMLAEFQSTAKTLSREENISLGNLLRGILVHVLTVDAPKVPVAYTIYGVTRVCHEDYYIHTSFSGQVSVIVSARVLRLPVEQQVNLDAIKKLFPPLIVDDYMKTGIRRMLDGSVRSKLEPLNMVQPKVDLHLFAFQITVKDSDVVQIIPNQKSHQKITYMHVPHITRVGAGIPGLTASKAILQQAPHSFSDHAFPAQGVKPFSGQTSHAQPHRQNSSEHSEFYEEWNARATYVPKAGVHSIADVGITRIRCGGSGPLHERPTNGPIKRTASDNSDSRKVLCTRIQSANHLQVPGEMYTSFHASPQNVQNTTLSLSKIRASEVQSVSGLPENAANGQHPNTSIGTTATTTDFSEDSLPRSFGGNARSSNSTSSIQRIRNEIYSWSNIPAKDIEARLLKGCDLTYTPPNPNNLKKASTGDPSFGMHLRQLENEGLVSKLVGLLSEKAVYNHLLQLYNSRRPLQHDSKTLGNPILSFGMDNWISSAREHFNEENRISDDSKGYDFYYEQVNGSVVYIEVKGHTAMTNSCILSANEWEVAKSYSGSTNAIYVILGINLNMLTMEGVRIAYVLEDPVVLEGNGSIARKPRSYVIEIFPKDQAVPTPTCDKFGGVKRESGTTNDTKSTCTAQAIQTVGTMALVKRRRFDSPDHV